MLAAEDETDTPVGNAPEGVDNVMATVPVRPPTGITLGVNVAVLLRCSVNATGESCINSCGA